MVAILSGSDARQCVDIGREAGRAIAGRTIAGQALARRDSYPNSGAGGQRDQGLAKERRTGP